MIEDKSWKTEDGSQKIECKDGIPTFLLLPTSCFNPKSSFSIADFAQGRQTAGLSGLTQMQRLWLTHSALAHFVSNAEFGFNKH